jgi:hypothetical protein
MKKRWTIRELALLLLPVVALGAFGLWMRGKNVSAKKFEFTLQSVEVVPATPRDVYEGFDTLVKVKYDFPPAPKLPNAEPAAKPSGIDEPKLFYKTRGKVQRVQLLPTDIAVMNFAGEDRAEIRLRLRTVPTKYGELTLKSAARGSFWYNVRGTGTEKDLKVPPRSFSIVVRRAGERVTMPQVSKYRPFRIKTISRDRTEKWPAPLERKLIKVTIENFQPTDNERWRFLRSRLIDSRGKEYKSSIKVGTQYVSWVQISEPADHLVDKHNLVRWFSFPLDLIPKSAGKITFKTEVSLNDSWPLPISYVVRP